MLTMTVAARPQVAETILPAAGQPVDCDCTKFDENGVQVVDDDGVRAGCAAVGAEFGTLNTREDGGLDDDQSQNLVVSTSRPFYLAGADCLAVYRY